MALTIGFLGISTIITSFIHELSLGGNFLFGVLITLMSVFTWTAGTIISMRSKLNANPYRGIGWQMLFGGLMLQASSMLFEKQVPIQSIPAASWLYFAYLVAIGSILCFMCYLYALQTLPMSLVSIYVYINPMVALILGLLLLHEAFSLQIILGVAITFTGIYLVKRYSK